MRIFETNTIQKSCRGKCRAIMDIGSQGQENSDNTTVVYNISQKCEQYETELKPSHSW